MNQRFDNRSSHNNGQLVVAASGTCVSQLCVTKLRSDQADVPVDVSFERGLVYYTPWHKVSGSEQSSALWRAKADPALSSMCSILCLLALQSRHRTPFPEFQFWC